MDMQFVLQGRSFINIVFKHHSNCSLLASFASHLTSVTAKSIPLLSPRCSPIWSQIFCIHNQHTIVYHLFMSSPYLSVCFIISG